MRLLPRRQGQRRMQGSAWQNSQEDPAVRRPGRLVQLFLRNRDVEAAAEDRHWWRERDANESDVQPLFDVDDASSRVAVVRYWDKRQPIACAANIAICSC